MKVAEISKLQEVLPIHLYGQGQAKDFASLLSEIEKGEAQIVWEDLRPLRWIKVCRVKVITVEKGLSLWEERQVFADGRVRHRNIQGLAEKLLPNEKPEDAADRALKEELGLSDEAIALTQIEFDGVATEEKESPSYPGLATRYEFYDFKAYFPIKFWQEEFVEGSDDDVKKTYFTWKCLNTSIH
jgi:hypothetical protein